jgi:hypothetical protein
MDENHNDTPQQKTPAADTPAPADTASLSSAGSATSPREKRDRWVKLGFLGVIIVVAGIVYMLQQKPMSIAGWSEDLEATLVQAKQQDRPVVAFFVNQPPSETAEATKANLTRPENIKVMQEYKVLRVLVTTDTDSEIARRFNIESLPTLLLLSPEGEELNRHDGPSHVGEVPFRDEFLTVLPTD